MAKAPLSRVIRAAAHDPPCQGKEKNCTFGRCRGGLHADSCQRDAAPVVRKVGVVPGAISARGQPPTCNIHASRPQLHSRAGRLFFLTFSRHGVLLKERTASIRGCRDLLATLTTAGSPSTRRAWGRAPYIRRGRPRRHRRDTSCRSRKRAELEVTTTTTLRAPPRQGPRRRRTRPQIARAAISNTPPARFHAPCPPTAQILKYRRPFWR